ncbi:MAG TPA: molybdopterin-synthase adenylyltransferase MoeB [Rhizomicrobium sp.]|jgi:adenylyltransferase/sulfurtransferase|nr:molybdopterin-synthase adenylyltransferase MoeB [Rhizomicrobium sp.]
MSLSDEELDRYARHLVLRQVGGTGQAKIRAASVLMVGAGGLGSPAALYLAAAGIGRLGLVDDDSVSLSNLQRQILFRTTDVGRAKVEAGAEALKALNPGVRIDMHPVRLTSANVMALIADYDIITDGSDNFATRFLLNDACFFARKPLVSAAVTEFEGQLATYKAHEPGLPCYRCLFPEPPPAGTVPSCSQTGVLGAAAGVMGSLQALEVLKEVAGLGTGLAGKILVYKALTSEFHTARLPRDPTCPLCGTAPTITGLSAHG